ncbi:asparagine synthase (glutamine-hydrolyzing) [Pedobacter caeni]|uniref:asparagine synthase (glutamine-hydrolyzing) n=1 Tax=Pedobacter caeni TaxID=288992 RepID=A0A1M5GFU5_9SPHI|nr:asparagine synthase (glutamine-hydrolyzing) [Pedobacter caeni]SHG02568.1 asparagine synthase (glutamine-hydrolysing) [Pedobacter caeni]
MCGIFGTLNYEYAVSEEQVFAGLLHRGPDEQGCFNSRSVNLYHTRLAIQDLSTSGQQPMKYNGLVIVFNGEIYNHMELRKKYRLEAVSNSDTLTILMLFERIGMKMLEEFDGMFAFALYDTLNLRLYLARDRAGKKPLYIYQKGESFVFSSELNILQQVCKPEINYAALADYLYLGHHYRKATPYHLVNELENGHYVVIDTLPGQAQDICWFKIEEAYRNDRQLPYEDALMQLDQHLNRAVKRRIESADLDVGSFLSGGIDSGIVTAMAAQQQSRLKTFTVKVAGSFDESLLAEKVARKYDTDHTVVEIDFSDLSNDIEKIISNHGEPNSDNSAIPSYYVAREAKKYITVVLNGDGADELFGGYRRYVPFKHIDFFNPNQFTKISSGILAKILPVANQKQSLYTYCYRLLKFASYTDLVKIYCSASSDLFVGFEDVFIQKPTMLAITSDLERYNSYAISPLKKLLLMDFESMLFSRLLPKMDIATMAHSIEGRSPFLAKEVLDFAPGLPDHFKIRNIQTKQILRDLGKRYLPEALIHQPKRGFEIPLQKWVDHELWEVMQHYLFAGDALYPKIIRKEFIEQLIARRISISDERRAKILFCVFSLEVWHKSL